MHDGRAALHLPIEIKGYTPIHLPPLNEGVRWSGRPGGESTNKVLVLFQDTNEMGADDSGAASDEDSMISVVYKDLSFCFRQCPRNGKTSTFRFPRLVAKLFRESDRQEHNHHRRIRMAIGGKYGSARDIQTTPSVDLRLSIDDPLSGTFRHARCAGRMGWIIEFCGLVVALLHPAHQVRGRQTQAGEFLSYQRGETRDAPAFLVSNSPINTRDRHAKPVPTLGKAYPAVGVRSLFDHGIQNQAIKAV